MSKQQSLQASQQEQQQAHTHNGEQCNFCPQTFQPSNVYVSRPVQLVQQVPVQQVALQTSQVVQQQATQPQITGSRLEYIPYTRTEVEYKQVQETIVENIEVDDVEYREVERKVIEYVPREIVDTHYNVVEYQKQYVPKTVYHTVTEQVPVKTVEQVPVQRTEMVAQQRTDYITQSRQVPHVEYDEVEYQVTKPVVQSQAPTQTFAQQPLEVSQVIQQPTQYVYQQQPVQYVQSQVLPNTSVVQRPALIQSNIQYVPVQQEQQQQQQQEQQ